MNAQEVYTKVRKHLLKQGVRSVSGMPLENRHLSCAYRGTDGTKCAVGCLITDEAYNPDFEHRCVGHPKVVHALLKSGVDVYEHIPTADGLIIEDLLNSLQTIHDIVDPSEWANKLDFIATRYGLKAE